MTVNGLSCAIGVPVKRILDVLEAEGVSICNINAEIPDKYVRRIEEKLSQAESKTKAAAERSSQKHNGGYEKVLDSYASSFKIFIDTCSFMHDGIADFYAVMKPYMQKYNNKFIISKRVAEELNRLSEDKKAERAKKAANGIHVVNKMLSDGLALIKGEESDDFADQVFHVVFTKFRMKYNLMLITQDNNLGTEILALNNQQSVKSGKRIAVKKLGNKGQLYNINYTDRAADRPVIDKFKLEKDVIKYKNDSIEVSHIPTEGETVYDKDGKPILLGKDSGSGGEGTIYPISNGNVVKIYKAGKLTRSKKEKIELMVSKPIKCEGICWPIGLIRNRKGEFVGYEMPKAVGKTLQTAIFTKPVFMKTFPGWTKINLVNLCIDILRKIEYLHERNIILGDINPQNILIDNNSRVYFVDTDSYQIEGYPCPVGTIPFKAQELFADDKAYYEKYRKSRAFCDYLRTFNNEYFAVAVLLFEIMLPGKHPYALQGGASIEGNIIKMDFAYPLGEKTNGKTPDGQWRYIWSHMPYEVKEAFYETFRKDGNYSINRLNASKWRKYMEKYKNLLDSGTMRKQDPMSERIFPTRFKEVKSEDVIYVKCCNCGDETPSNKLQAGMCRRCLHEDGEDYKCSRCGKDMFFSNYAKFVKKAKKSVMCSDCYNRGKAVYQRKTCRSCGKVFTIINNEAEFYRARGLDIPVRCTDCRGKKTADTSPYASYIPEYRPSKQSTPPPRTVYNSSNASKPSNASKASGASEPPKKKKGCYITTAVCGALGRPDDCYELTALRAFRDTWLKSSPGGAELIEEYYNTAPDLVKKIDERNDRDEIYAQILEEYINPCIKYIEDNKPEECRDRYIEMVGFVKEICEQ